MNEIIRIKGLNYQFGDFRVLENINLSVGANTIFGFLGPNGAGKTTTIKLLLGLLTAGDDSIFLFGQSVKKNRIGILAKTGSLVENPSIYNHLTAWENLYLVTTMLGLKESRIGEVLETVGLIDVAKKKAGQFSTGMKQRLGIAKALLPDPELILLDEPTIGLDPTGIIEVRELLMHLKNDRGKTIFLSSHLLHEVEKVCTDVAIINKGKILFQGPMERLNTFNSSSLRIKTDNIIRTQRYLEEQNIPFTRAGQHAVTVPFTSDKATAVLIRGLADKDIGIWSAEKSKNTLEELFIQLIKE